MRRRAGRGVYDRETIDAILDEGLVGHLAFAVDGQPYALPMLYARRASEIYLHGSPLSRLLRTAGAGAPMCLTVTLVDGLVLARSAFHHSINYRSAVVLGSARLVTEREEKDEALRLIVEHAAPGRAADARAPSRQELKATAVVAMAIEEASAKARSGPPIDAAEDYALPVWAGELPLAVAAGAPVADPRCSVSEPPAYVEGWSRRRA